MKQLPPLPPFAAYIFSILVLFIFIVFVLVLQRKLSYNRKKYLGLLLPAFLFLGSILRAYALYKQDDIFEATSTFLLVNLFTLYSIKQYVEERRKRKMKTKGIEFAPVKTHKDLHPLYKQEGLEIGNEPVETRFVRSLGYKKERGKKGRYFAGASLGKRGDYLILDSIAVDKELQGQGIGERLMNELLHDLPYGEDLYLIAKAHDFFEKLGFEDIPLEDCPPVFGCLNCDRLDVDCFPRPMVLRKGKTLRTD